MSHRWAYSFSTVDPRDPTGNKKWTVGVQRWLIGTLYKQGLSTKICRLKLVDEVLASPSAICRGWARDGCDDCFIYLGEPEHDYRSETIEVPADKKMIFAVFVLPDGSIDDWNWKLRRSVETYLPVDEIGEVIWRQPTA